MGLIIAEELLLLTYQPDSTDPGKGTKLDSALAGAMLGELVLDGFAELDDKRLRAIDRTPAPSHPLLAEAHTKLGSKPRTPESFVPKLAERARRELVASLVKAGVLAENRRRVLGMFPNSRHPLADPAPREEVLARLREVVVNGADPDPRTATLACLVHVGGLAERIFPGDDQDAVTARLRELSEGSWTSDMVRKAIQIAIASKVISAVVTVAISAITNANNN